MTAFSYWKAKKKNEQFEEPKMLGKLMHNAAPGKIPLKTSIFAGWILHYGVGLAFNSLYHQWWKTKTTAPKAMQGLLLGVPSGAIGIIAWHTAIKLHSNPPETQLKDYYKQLFVAHLIFGLTSAIAYRKA